MKFQSPQYAEFFGELLCKKSETLDKYAAFFDLRDPKIKRDEFNRKIKRPAWQELERSHGLICQLQYAGDCEINNPAQVDHVIPLSSNELNKKLRSAKPGAPGKKIAAESFGSNDISNLVLACKNCNSNKKHRFLDREQMRRILRTKGL